MIAVLSQKIKYFCRKLVIHPLGHILNFFNQHKFYLSFSVFAGLILLLAGCSVKKNTFLSRNYHSITTHYNGWFNGNESLKEGVASLEASHQDDYTKVLDIYKYGTPESSKSIYPQMDKAILKASTQIQKHSMLIKNKEYNRWIDDSYMLIGKSHFYKRDHYPALEMFQYVYKQYPESKTRFEALLWLIRTYAELGRFKDGQGIIDIIENEKEFPKKLIGEYALVQADFLIKQEEYGKAAPELIKAIANTKDKRRRTRYTYILAQLYEKLGDKTKASFYYTQVLKKNPTYEMAFNAKINLALQYDAATADGSSLKKELIKMSKDDKNIDYLDRIYFALAEIELAEGNKPKAKEYFAGSVKYSTTNTRQKGISYLRLGELYFDDPDYVKAEAYYDSALTFISDDYEDFDAIKNMRKSLGDLIKNLNTIAFQDSVLKLANMSETELNLYIDDLIAKVVEEEERQKFEAENQQNTNPFQQNQQTQNTQSSGGQWYFYNTGALSFGYSEFRKLWGNRVLEDHWRRSNKESIDIQQFDDDEELTPEDSALADNKSRDYYLKDIPKTQGQKDTAHQAIIAAFFNLGMIYSEQIGDKPRSIEAFEELLKRYPKNEFKASAAYQLYRLYTARGNTDKANYYKNLIIREFPETEYAKILLDPDYFTKLQAEMGKIGELYEQAYNAFNEAEYFKVIELADKAMKAYPGNKLLGRFDYLKVLCIGRTERVPDFKLALEGFIKKYPEDDMTEEAKRTLAYIAEMTGETENLAPSTPSETAPVEVEEEEKPEPAPYVYKDKGTHRYVVVVSQDDFKLNDFKVKLSNFNQEFFGLISLSVKTSLLGPKKHLIYVQTFVDQAKAMDYYETIKQNQAVFEGIDKANYKHFVISSANFPIFYQFKDVDEYLQFFQKNYLKKEN